MFAVEFQPLSAPGIHRDNRPTPITFSGPRAPPRSPEEATLPQQPRETLSCHTGGQLDARIGVVMPSSPRTRMSERRKSVIKDLQITLYEIFGYLLPGMVLFTSLLLVFWAIYFPTPSIGFDLKTTEVWLAFLLFSYVAGHMGQAVGNLIQKRISSAEKLVLGQNGELSPAVLKACKDKAAKTYEVDVTALDEYWLFRLCDDAVLRSGKLGEREIFQYREGFYRGTAVGFAALSVASLCFMVRLWFVEGHSLKVTGADWSLTPWQFLFIALVALVFSVLAFQRYRRFGAYRVTHAMLGFLTVSDAGKSDTKDKQQNPGVGAATPTH